MKLIVWFDGTSPTYGGFEDAVFLDLPTEGDAEDIEEMLYEIARQRGTVPDYVEHVIFERPAD